MLQVHTICCECHPMQDSLLALLEAAPNDTVSRDMAAEALKLEKKALKAKAKAEAAKAASKGKAKPNPRSHPP